ncbi:MAG: galactokinase [Eudoraea sp.]|nr:galactokinase [Eudoraea sp.]
MANTTFFKLANKAAEADLVIHSPGRINLIGEHIDYNGGFVLPAAIDKHIEIYFKKNSSSIFNFYSEDLDTGISTTLLNLAPGSSSFENFVLGILAQYVSIGHKSMEGFDCYIRSNLPIGAGISSSAALLCGLAKGINELFTFQLSEEAIMVLAQQAEHSYVGTNSGIMDQFAVIKGSKNGVLFLDCKTMAHEVVPVNFESYDILLLNTNVSHTLENSEYNTRRKECETALTIINQPNKSFEYLTQVPKDTLLTLKDTLDPLLYNRALFVIEENIRVQKAVHHLKRNALEEFGSLLYKSHYGLKNLYEVSCPELDFLVEQTKNKTYIPGARMMGGGFGGCTINLINKEYRADFVKEISAAYFNNFSRNLTPLVVAIGSGVRIQKH